MLKVIRHSVYLLLCCLWSSALWSDDRMPNILLLLADDMGVNDSQLYADLFHQQPVAIMPSLDMLANEGLRYSRFYTESTCSASRVALLTGQYPARQGFTPVARGISPQVQTLPEYLRSHGYRTHHVGKWHAGEINSEAFPANQGFDSSFGFLSQWMLRGPAANGEIKLSNPTYHDPWLINERGEYQQEEGHLEDILADHTQALIRDADGEAPWFIYHAFLAPHTPLQPPVRYARHFGDSPDEKYRALLTQMNENLQSIFETLKESGQWENTIIIFASDNGAAGKHKNSNKPFVGHKASYGEGGIRAPLVIKWPAELGAHVGGIEDRAVSIMDIYPSLQALLEPDRENNKTQHNGREQLDGRSSLLPGTSISGTHQFFAGFGEFSVFNSVFDRRLIRSWRQGQGSEDSLLVYDEHSIPGVDSGTLWSRLLPFMKGETQQLQRTFYTWADKVFRVRTVIESIKRGKQYRITGSDFLRTPVNPGYALHFSFSAFSVKRRQTLLHQQGVMELYLENGALYATVHGMPLKYDGIQPDTCYDLILSGEFYDRYNTVKDNTMPSRYHLLLNGERISSADHEIESLAAVNISAPTTVGYRSTQPGYVDSEFEGKLFPPEFYATQLLDENPLLGAGVSREILCW